MIEIGLRLTAVIIVLILGSIQVGAWYMGFDGQVTMALTTAIVSICSIVFGIKVVNKLK